MGFPISSILAEIYIHNIEQTLILNTENNKHAHKIIYVDDILLVYNGSSKQMEQFHTHTSISYTLNLNSLLKQNKTNP